MKIDSIIIDQEQANASYLRQCLLSNFPELHIHGEASNRSEATRLIKTANPSLIFMDIDTVQKNALHGFPNYGSVATELVYLSYRAEDAMQAIHHGASGFLLKPLNASDVVLSVSNSIRRLGERFSVCPSTPDQSSVSQLPIGIPTMEGIEFLNASEIIRCEGLQKCTRIVTTRRNSLVSSYSIGEFKKLFDRDHFFPCHKSHLINLMYVRKLTREGFIIMIDNIAVPLARRKRIEFLDNVRHL